MLNNPNMAEELIELRGYSTRNIEFKTPWVLEELKVEEVSIVSGSKYFVDFMDHHGTVQFSVGSESKRIRNEFKTDTFMKEADRSRAQKSVLKSLFMDTFKSKTEAHMPTEMRVDSVHGQKFVNC